MNKICTSVEQSKKLLELGIDVNTADIYHTTFYGRVDRDLPLPKEVYDILNHPINKDKIIPAWSLSALLSILNFPALTQENDDEWEVCVCDFDNGGYIEKIASNPIDACYKMICWLKENGKI